jgi:ABC-type multidrug transport system ATPase subunit/pSer/pThr/pTyr-binding forkhead associated (FHA) protein
MELPVSAPEVPPDPPSPNGQKDQPSLVGRAGVDETAVTARPMLTVLSGLPGASYELAQGETVIGRSGEADLQLKHPEISRRHCKLTWAGGQTCTIEDLRSRWGTKINGAAISSEVATPVQPGDRIHVGPVIIYLGFGPPPGAAAAQATPDAPAEALEAEDHPRVLIGGREVEAIPLKAHLRLGRAGDVDVVLADPSISRQHATIEHLGSGYQITDLRSRTGSLVNGRRFEKHELVIGDQLQIGPFHFRFDGRLLERTSGLAGVEIQARYVRKQAGPIMILENVSLKIERGQFVAFLGPSGSGKTSLLDALTGLRPADSGSIRYDGADLYEDYERLRSVLGYVPQDDIVHRELTVSAALLFSARLRLPARTPSAEIFKFVTQIISQLGLSARAHTPIHRLSGGQRKRVSVGVELLGRPSVLFLDEPTSGLDPAAEFKMMELLRHLADGGCTVVCATHMMENVYLVDRLFIIASGKLVFTGSAQEAREQFGVQKLTMLYDRLEERPAAAWQTDFQQIGMATNVDPVAQMIPPPVPPSPRVSSRPAAALPVLLRRQWAILSADWKNFLILFGQPLIIALLVAWVTDDTSLSLFFTYLATLWFGCSNAAQEIVREIAIYRRERMVGLSRHSYLLSKFVLIGGLTALQGVFLYLCLWGARWILYPSPDEGVERGLDGSALWQMGSVVCTAFSAVGIGFAISALARSTMQAVMIVPLVLILFSGLVVETNQMSSKAVFLVTNAMPSYAAQTMMDVGAFWRRRINGGMYSDRRKGGDHLRDLEARSLRRSLPPERADEATGLARSALGMGKIYDGSRFGIWAAIKLLLWTLASYWTAWFALRAKEQG